MKPLLFTYVRTSHGKFNPSDISLAGTDGLSATATILNKHVKYTQESLKYLHLCGFLFETTWKTSLTIVVALVASMSAVTHAIRRSIWDCGDVAYRVIMRPYLLQHVLDYMSKCQILTCTFSYVTYDVG